MRYFGSLAVGLAFLLPSHSYGLTLPEALALTYQKNPELKVQRQNLKVTDENVSQANYGWLPSSSITVERGYQEVDRENSGGSDNLIDNRRIDFTQPVYKGGRTIASVKKAKQETLKARFELQSKEQTILLNAITAYMDVVRYQERLSLAKSNENVFSKQLELSTDRFNLGELTKTDVAQSKTSLAKANAERVEMEGLLQKANGNFEQYIGELPTTVTMPELPPVPTDNVNDLVHMAYQHHPDIKAAEANIQAAKNNVAIEKSYLLPSIDIIAGHSENNTALFNGTTEEYETDSIKLNVSIPLFNSETRGAEYSRIRQAKRQKETLAYELDSLKTSLRNNIIQAYQDIHTTRNSKQSLETTSASAQTVLEGTEEEEKAGSRTTLDVLEARQDVFEAKNNLLDNQVNEIIHSYTLLAYLGKLTVDELKLDIARYDANTYHDDVDTKFFGW